MWDLAKQGMPFNSSSASHSISHPVFILLQALSFQNRRDFAQTEMFSGLGDLGSESQFCPVLGL